MTVLTRYILRSLLVNYLIASSVMLSLYVVLDLFVNVDEFTEQGYPFPTVLANIADYYGPNLLLYFSHLSGAITAFACLATVARMRKLNEMTAMLASGVSLYRLAAPVVAFGLATTALLVVDAEWLIPRVAPKLARDHDDVDARRAYDVLFLPDRDGALLSAARFHPARRDLQGMLVIRRDPAGAITETIEADRAVWIPDPQNPAEGRWRLERGRQRIRETRSNGGLGPVESIVEKYPLDYPSSLGPDVIQLRQTEKWLRFLSLAELRRLETADWVDRASILQARHARITAPIVSVVLLLLGLPFFLDRSPGNLLHDAGRCLAVCGLCYASAFVAQSVRTTGESALPVWMPIFIFATLAMVLIDRIRT